MSARRRHFREGSPTCGADHYRTNVWFREGSEDHRHRSRRHVRALRFVVVHERIRLVVTVKAYPTASVKYGEAVCVAGIRTDTRDPKWVRLYPVDFRDLPFDKQFKKWSEIEIDVSESSDTRPESLRPDTTSITVVRDLGTARRWADRRPLVEPLLVESMCAARERQRLDGTSLAAFRPASVIDVAIEPEPDDWTPQQLKA